MDLLPIQHETAPVADAFDLVFQHPVIKVLMEEAAQSRRQRLLPFKWTAGLLKYQQEACQQMIQVMQNNRRHKFFLQCCTGAGKTLMALALCLCPELMGLSVGVPLVSAHRLNHAVNFRKAFEVDPQTGKAPVQYLGYSAVDVELMKDNHQGFVELDTDAHFKAFAKLFSQLQTLQRRAVEHNQTVALSAQMLQYAKKVIMPFVVCNLVSVSVQKLQIHFRKGQSRFIVFLVFSNQHD